MTAAPPGASSVVRSTATLTEDGSAPLRPSRRAPAMTAELPAASLAQLRWLVAALRTEDDDERDAREALATRLERALIGAPAELSARVADAAASDDVPLLVRLAARHEELVEFAASPEERTARRGRARRYREIAQMLGLM